MVYTTNTFEVYVGIKIIIIKNLLIYENSMLAPKWKRKKKKINFEESEKGKKELKSRQSLATKLVVA